MTRMQVVSPLVAFPLLSADLRCLLHSTTTATWTANRSLHTARSNSNHHSTRWNCNHAGSRMHQATTTSHSCPSSSSFHFSSHPRPLHTTTTPANPSSAPSPSAPSSPAPTSPCPSSSSSSSPISLHLGQTFTSTRTFSLSSGLSFASLTGDHNPIHLSPTGIVHGLFTASTFGTLFASHLPGSVYISQSLRFRSPVHYDVDEVTSRVRVKDMSRARRGIVVCETVATKRRKGKEEEGEVVVVEGEAYVKVTNLKDKVEADAEAAAAAAAASQ